MTRFDGDAVALVERDGAAQERDRGGGFLVGEHLGVGQAGGVIDRDVNGVPAPSSAATPAASVARGPRCALPVTRLPAPPRMRPSFLTSMWISSPGRGARSDGRFQPEPAELAHPDPLQHRADRRDRHVEQLASSGAVNRNRRNAANNCTVAHSVRLGTRLGALERSNNPACPRPASGPPTSSRPPTHSGRLRRPRDRPALLDHPSTIRRRPFRLSAALACNLIRVLLGTGASQPPASKEDRMNNVPQELHLAPADSPRSASLVGDSQRAQRPGRDRRHVLELLLGHRQSRQPGDDLAERDAPLDPRQLGPDA